MANKNGTKADVEKIGAKLKTLHQQKRRIIKIYGKCNILYN